MTHHSKKDSQSSNSKSRNHTQATTNNFQEYFSFSNMERENMMKTQSSHHSSQVSLHKHQLSNGTKSTDRFKPLESTTRMERSDTMIKLTLGQYNNSALDPLKASFTDLTGDVLDIISEYFP